MKKIIFTSGIFVSLIFSGCGVKLSKDTVVNAGEKEGLIKSNGDVAVKPTYDRINTFHGEYEKYYHPNYFNFHAIHDNKDESYAVVKNFNNKFGVIDKHGNQKLKVMYDSIGIFHNGFAKIEIDGKYGLVNENFDVVLKPVYDEVQEFVFNTAIVKQGDKYGCLDKNINFKIKPILDMVYLQSEGLKRVELNDKWGFIDINCEFVAKPVYDYAYDFRNGFAKVKEAGLWGFLDKDGRLLTKQIFDDADRF